MRRIIFILLTLFLLGFASAEIVDYTYILSVDSTSVYPETIYPNSEVSLNLVLTNLSTVSDAKDIKVELTSDNRFFETLKSEDYLNVIKFSQTGTATLRFKVNSDVPGGYYSVPIKITYNKGDSKTTIDTQTSITVVNYDKLNVVLTSYPKTKTYLDENFSIAGFVKNEGNTTLKGISVDSEFGSATLIPLEETSLFIGDLEPNQIKEFNFNFIIPKSATPDTYDINIIAEDVSNNQDSERVAFVVSDLPTLIISSIDKSLENNATYLTQGMHFSLSIQLENIAKSKAKSVVIEIVDKTTEIEGSTIAYVGSIDDDDSGAGVFDLYISPNAETGDQKITAKITYTDEYDVEHSFTKEVSLFIDKAEQSSNAFLYIVILLVVAGIGYYFYNRSKKQKHIRQQ